MAERIAYASSTCAVSASSTTTSITPAGEKNGLGGGRSFELTALNENVRPNSASPAHIAQPVQSAHIAQSHSPLVTVPRARRAELCAVQVRVGSEDAMARRILKIAGDAAQDAFALRRELMRREDGIWRVRRDVLFPGYVIVETADPALLEERLKVLTETSHLLRGAGDAVATLDEREAELVRSLGGSARTVGVSRGVIQNSALRVTAGPLMGLEQLVAKVNRHKRIAYLDAAAFGCLAAGGRRPGQRVARLRQEEPARRQIRVALEVVSKT